MRPRLHDTPAEVERAIDPASVEVRPVHEPEPAHLPTPVLVLDSLSRMPPATAITIILTVAGMTLGTVVAIVAVLGMVLATVAAVAGSIAIAGIGAALAAIVLDRPR
jgi:hypothetical protein